MNKSTRGGKRPNSGRKPVKEKKTAVFAYVLPSDVQTVGGKESAKSIAEQAITRAAKKINKIV
jgi:hypothetical protein